MARTIFLKTYPRLFLPEFQKRNSWIVTAYSDENDEKSEFYNAYYIYKYYYCSFCGTVEITKKRAKRKDNYYGGHTCQVCKHTEFLNLYCNNEFFKAKNISFELYENEDFYHIQPYTPDFVAFLIKKVRIPIIKALRLFLSHFWVTHVIIVHVCKKKNKLKWLNKCPNFRKN